MSRTALLHRPACRLWRAVRIGWLRWEISSAEQWVRYAERDGVLESDNLRRVRREISQKVIQLAIVRSTAA